MNEQFTAAHFTKIYLLQFKNNLLNISLSTNNQLLLTSTSAQYTIKYRQIACKKLTNVVN